MATLDAVARTARELTAAYRSRLLSPVDVTRAHLDRIEEHDAVLGTYLFVDGTGALAAAEAADRRYREGRPAGPLDGVPIGVKDNIDVRGLPTTGGSTFRDPKSAERDAKAVARLRAGGAIILGKHSLFELAGGGAPRFEGDLPAARNPWSLARATGGSSSGSAAAVAADLATLAIGTDSGGSVRFPAALCGVAGFKPSLRSVPTTGVLVHSWSLDTVGPLARCALDIETATHAMAGTECTDHPEPRPDAILRGRTVGVPEELLAQVEEMDREVLGSFRAAIEQLRSAGATLVSVDLPGALFATAAGSVILRAEAHAAYAREARQSPRAFGRRFYNVLLQGAALSSADYLRAQRVRARLRESVRRAFTEVDLIATPTAPCAAWPIEEERTLFPRSTPNRHLFTFLFNLTGDPAVSLPCGLTEAGLPIGLQLAARHGADDAVLHAAHAFEVLQPWPRGAPAEP